MIDQAATAVKIGAQSSRQFGLVSSQLKRDRRTIEETQREMREKKLRKEAEQH